VLLSGAEKVLQDAEAALSLAKDAAAGRAGTLRIGFGIASVSELLPRTILRFRKTYAQVDSKMRDMSGFVDCVCGESKYHHRCSVIQPEAVVLDVQKPLATSVTKCK